MSRRKLLISLSIGVSLGCRQPSSEDDGIVGESESESAGDGDGDGDGDDTSDTGDGDGDGDAYCDLSRFPVLEPIWIEYLPQDPSTFFPSGLAVDANAIFSGSFRVVDGFRTDQLITRRSLDGQIEWSVDAPDYSGSLDWDGQHIYYLTMVLFDGPSGVWRMTADGQLDVSWSFEVDDTSIDYLNASGPHVLLTGEYIAAVDEWDPNYDWSNVITRWLDKGDWQLPGGSDADEFGELYENDRAGIVIPSASGGHFAAMTNLENGGLYLRGYHGATLDLAAGFLATSDPATSHPGFMFERPEGLLVSVGARTFYSTTAWLMGVGPDGSESWRMQYTPCGSDVSTFFGPATEGPNHFWGTMGFQVNEDFHESTLIEFDFDGELSTIHAFDDGLDGDVAWIEDIATNGTEVVIAGGTLMPDEARIGWIARIH